jgi:hypothetical protein
MLIENVNREAVTYIEHARKEALFVSKTTEA